MMDKYDTNSYLGEPVVNRKTYSRTSFKDGAENVGDDVLAQNFIISLDNAIKMEKRTKNTPEARRYK
jgi:hypothetical protein